MSVKAFNTDFCLKFIESISFLIGDDCMFIDNFGSNSEDNFGDNFGNNYEYNLGTVYFCV